MLTIEGADKIRATIDMLLESGEIEWQGSLKKTYDHYLHPDIIKQDDKKLYEMLGSGEIMDLFQFSTDIGLQSAVKVKPQNLIEVAAANSLMRLMSSGEQPIDTFIKYKNNIDLWYEEMNRYNLNIKEIKVMEKHLLHLSGVADTQESVMIMSMDENIAGFDVALANKLRKTIAKRDEKSLEAVYKEFFANGLKLGNRKEILTYVWEVQIKRMLGYAFSVLHTIAYSVICLQQLNLNLDYNPLYWQTACLLVNSGSQDSEDENQKNKSTEYGKVASAIGQMKSRGVVVDLPDVNKAGFGFRPDLENNSILFGLKGMVGIGDTLAHEIINNRPYISFKDFLSRMFETKKVQQSHMLQLIKGGCFEAFGERKEIMREFIQYMYIPKTQLNGQNLPMIIKEGLIPEQFKLQERFYNYKKYISKSVYKTISKPKDRLFKLDYISTNFLQEHFSEDCIVDIVDGDLIVSEKQIKKEYDKLMQPLMEWLKEEDTLKYVNDELLKRAFEPYEEESISKWEMSSLSYYHSDHELEAMNREKYNVVNFFELPKEPVVSDTYTARGIERQKYEISRIAGTVLDKDKNKHTVTVLTVDGVVTVKLYGGNFSFYDRQLSKKVAGDKKEVVEKGWFQRGNILMLTGFRRDNQFILRKYKDSLYSHTIALIKEIYDSGDVLLQTERAEV